MAQDDRFKLVEARCSSFAAERLRELKEHPRLFELLTELEKIDGPMYRIDIDSVLATLSRESDAGETRV
jgi:hypothetical protein